MDDKNQSYKKIAINSVATGNDDLLRHQSVDDFSSSLSLSKYIHYTYDDISVYSCINALRSTKKQ